MKKFLLGIIFFFGYIINTFAIYDISTATFSETINKGYYNYGFKFAENGTRGYSCGGATTGTCYGFTFSTPYDYNTLILDSSKVIPGSGGSFGTSFGGISNDGLKFYVFRYDTDVYSVGYLKEYNLNIAWDLSTSVFVQNFSIGWSAYTVFVKPDGSGWYKSRNGFIWEYSMVNGDISTSVYIQTFEYGNTALGNIYFSDDGLHLFVGGYYYPNVYYYTLGTAWDISTLFLENYINTGQQRFGVSVNDIGSILYFTRETSITDKYINTGSIGPAFNYFASGYSFHDNGFVYHNFIPGEEYYGGGLRFKITQPNTTDIYTSYYGDDVYGYDTAISITYPYHQLTGTYSVLPEYTYLIDTYELVGDTYFIPEYIIPEDFEGYTKISELDYNCDSDGDGVYSLSEGISCLINFISAIIPTSIEAFKNLADFFKVISTIGNGEEKDFGAFNFLINQTYANDLTEAFTEYDDTDDSIFLKNTYDFLKYFIMFILLIFILALMFHTKE